MWNSFRNNLHSFIFRLFTICTVISLSTSSAFASTVGQINSNVSFDFMNIASFKASSNAYFSKVSATPEYLATSSLLGSFINTFGPWYSYKIQTGSSGTPATYYETRDVNRHLQDISINQWFIDEDIRKLYDRYYTYSDGNAALLNQINTNTTNMYGSQSATNVQLASLNSINWQNTNSYLKRIVGADGTTNPSKYPYNQQYIDFVFDTISTSYNTENLFSIELPIQYWNTSTATSYVDHVEIVYGTVTQSVEYQIFYYPAQLGLNIYASYLPLAGGSVSEFSIRVYLNGNITYTSPETYIKYISKSNIDYLLENYYLLLNDIKNKDNQSKIVEAINNKTIEAELDNSIGTDDIQINESLPSGGLVDSARVITRLKSQFGTNVSVLDFLNNYNVSDLSGWYSTDNANVVQSINSSYTDLYD